MWRRGYRGRVARLSDLELANLSTEWGRRPPTRRPTRALARRERRIRAADPARGWSWRPCAPTLTENADALTSWLYLQQAVRRWYRGSFDVLAVQAYGLRGVRMTAGGSLRRDVLAAAAGAPADGAERRREYRCGHGSWWNVNPPSFAVQRFGRVTPSCRRATRFEARACCRAVAWMQVMYVWYWKRPDENQSRPGIGSGSRG